MLSDDAFKHLRITNPSRICFYLQLHEGATFSLFAIPSNILSIHDGKAYSSQRRVWRSKIKRPRPSATKEREQLVECKSSSTLRFVRTNGEATRRTTRQEPPPPRFAALSSLPLVCINIRNFERLKVEGKELPAGKGREERFVEEWKVFFCSICPMFVLEIRRLQNNLGIAKSIGLM